MLKNIIDLLNSQPWYGQSEIIEIAKGKYKAPGSIKEGLKQAKRQHKWLQNMK